MLLNGCKLRHDVGCSKSILVVKLEVGVDSTRAGRIFSVFEPQVSTPWRLNRDGLYAKLHCQRILSMRRLLIATTTV
jgi:hypothetical protein